MWFRRPLNPIETSKIVSNYYIDTLVAHFLWIQYHEILFMLCVSSSFIKSSRPWNIQVGQWSVGAQHVQGLNILCFSNGLTVPLSHKKNGCLKCSLSLLPHYRNIPPLYLIENLHLAPPSPHLWLRRFPNFANKLMLFMGETYISICVNEDIVTFTILVKFKYMYGKGNILLNIAIR